MLTKKKNGFTLIELLVVMIIIAILSAIALPAIIKVRQQASVNKVMAEMTSFASTGSMIYIDLKSKGYVRLKDFPVPNPVQSGGAGTSFDIPQKIRENAIGYDTELFTSGTAGNFVNLSDFVATWDGPYAVYQPKTTFDPTATLPIGKYPSIVTGTGWVADGTDFPTGTPLDAWGYPYGMGWNITEQVMVIYSAGPNGRFETGCGAILAGDKNADGTVAPAPTEYPGSDDLLYKFR